MAKRIEMKKRMDFHLCAGQSLSSGKHRIATGKECNLFFILKVGIKRKVNCTSHFPLR